MFKKSLVFPKSNSLIFSALLILFKTACFAQSDSSRLPKPTAPVAQRVLFIKNINVSGNKHTKRSIVVREMSMKAGDTVHLYNLMPRLQRDEKLLMNLSLFNWAKLNATNWTTDKNGGADTIDINVELDEALAFYPVPIAEIADRNFYVWLNQYNASLARVNWILKLTHFNVTGRADRLAALVQFGYSDKYQLTYRTPYLDKANTLRATVSGLDRKSVV